MRKFSIFLNIVLILSITTFVLSYRGEENGRLSNRDAHQVVVGYWADASGNFERILGEKIPLSVLYLGKDSDEGPVNGPLKAHSQVTSVVSIDGQRGHFIDASSYVKCEGVDEDYEGRFSVRAAVHPAWNPGTMSLDWESGIPFQGELVVQEDNNDKNGNPADGEVRTTAEDPENEYDVFALAAKCDTHAWIYGCEPEEPDNAESPSGGCGSGGCGSGGGDDDEPDCHGARSYAPFDMPEPEDLQYPDGIPLPAPDYVPFPTA